MKKMKLAEEFVNNTFKEKAVLKENLLTVSKLTREELISLMEHARANKIKYSLTKTNEGYTFVYKFNKEALREDLEDSFWAIVSMRIDDVEEVERYEDFDDARADFKYIVEEEPDGFEYAVLQKSYC